MPGRRQAARRARSCAPRRRPVAAGSSASDRPRRRSRPAARRRRPGDRRRAAAVTRAAAPGGRPARRRAREHEQAERDRRRPTTTRRRSAAASGRWRSRSASGRGLGRRLGRVRVARRDDDGRTDDGRVEREERVAGQRRERLRGGERRRSRRPGSSAARRRAAARSRATSSRASRRGRRRARRVRRTRWSSRSATPSMRYEPSASRWSSSQRAAATSAASRSGVSGSDSPGSVAFSAWTAMPVTSGVPVQSPPSNVEREAAVVALRAEQRADRGGGRLDALGGGERHDRERLPDHVREVAEVAAIDEPAGVALEADSSVSTRSSPATSRGSPPVIDTKNPSLPVGPAYAASGASKPAPCKYSSSAVLGRHERGDRRERRPSWPPAASRPSPASIVGPYWMNPPISRWSPSTSWPTRYVAASSGGAADAARRRARPGRRAATRGDRGDHRRRRAGGEREMERGMAVPLGRAAPSARGPRQPRTTTPPTNVPVPGRRRGRIRTTTVLRLRPVGHDGVDGANSVVGRCSGSSTGPQWSGPDDLRLRVSAGLGPASPTRRRHRCAVVCRPVAAGPAPAASTC